jgi:tetratricopeptide (TPR) repeat protein
LILAGSGVESAPARKRFTWVLGRSAKAVGVGVALLAVMLTLCPGANAQGEDQSTMDVHVRAMLAPLAEQDDAATRRAAATELRKLGDRAVPELIRARRGGPPRLARWATAQLDAMNRKVPGDCVQTKDPELLADVLRAFGDIRDPDAMGVVLSFVNADRDEVRTAARAAVSAYGGDALGRLRESYAGLAGKPAPPEWSAADAARALFALDDEMRLRDVTQLTQGGMEKERRGELDAAILDFDRALARRPDLDQRADLAPIYVRYALSIEDGDPTRAISYLRKATMLAPDGPRAGQASSEIVRLEAEDLRTRGVVDAEMFRRSLELDPTNARARATLDRIEGDASERRQRIRRAGELGGALAALAIGLLLFVGKKKR